MDHQWDGWNDEWDERDRMVGTEIKSVLYFVSFQVYHILSPRITKYKIKICPMFLIGKFFFIILKGVSFFWRQ